MQIQELGEKAVLTYLSPFCDQRIGDDCALMGELQPGHEMVITSDMLVQGVHFSPETTPAYSVGWRSATANLSDIAAMGAKPWGLTVSLGLPPSSELEWLLGVYEGLRDCARQYKTTIVGGDLVRSTIPIISITAVGQVQIDRAIQRRQAQVGDVILCSGQHGLAKGGLELLLHPELQKYLPAPDTERLIKAHQLPQPRFDVIALLEPFLNRSIGGMDSSDGLADAVQKICWCSGVGAQITWNQIPIDPALQKLADKECLDWVLYGGEDFQLVLTLAPSIAQTLIELDPNLHLIGEIVSPDQGNLHLLNDRHSFTHFGP